MARRVLGNTWGGAAVWRAGPVGLVLLAAVLAPPSAGATGDGPPAAKADGGASPERIRRWFRERMREVKESTGAAPSVQEFKAIRDRAEAELVKAGDMPEGVMGAVYEDLRAMQEPVASADDLVQIARARRDGIRSAKVRWVSVFDGEGLSPEWPTHMVQKGEMTVKRPRVLVQESLGPSEDETGFQRTLSFDGEEERSRTLPGPGDTWTNLISGFVGLDEYFKQGNPFFEALLVDSEESYQFSQPDHDLVKLVSGWDGPPFVQEKLERVNGRDCLLVTDLIRQVYLAPDLGFAPVRYYSQGQTADFSDFRDCGDGIWFPFSMALSLKRGGKVVRKIAVTVGACQINPPVDDSTFVDIFPRGSSVQDNLRHVTYRVGSIPSLAGTLDGLVTNRPASRPWWLIGLNVVIITCVVLATVVVRRKGKRAALPSEGHPGS